MSSSEQKMNRVTLNIPYDMPDDKWIIVSQIYKTMPNWQGYVDDGCPVWNIEDGETISASVEPSGLVIGEAHLTQTLQNGLLYLLKPHLISLVLS